VVASEIMKLPRGSDRPRLSAERPSIRITQHRFTGQKRGVAACGAASGRVVQVCAANDTAHSSRDANQRGRRSVSGCWSFERDQALSRMNQAQAATDVSPTTAHPASA
jgi:hypothetical protein